MQSVGVPTDGIYMDKSKILKVLEKHPEMNIDIIKKLPNMIDNPVTIMKSKTDAESFVVLGDLFDKTGQPVMAALKINIKNHASEVETINKVTSSYVKDNLQWLINTSNILYTDPNKERTNSWFQTLRLQLPAGVTNGGSTSNIAYALEDVNIRKKIEVEPSSPNQLRLQLPARGTHNGSISNIAYAPKDVNIQNKAEQMKAIQRVAQKLGRSITYFDAPSNINGKYENGSIKLNRNSPSPLLQTFAHELTHSIEGSRHYAALQREILQSKGSSLRQELESVIKEYSSAGFELDTEGAYQEIVARYVENTLLTDEKSITELAKKNRSLVQRVSDWLHEMIVKLSGTKEQYELQRIRAMYARALNDAENNSVEENLNEVHDTKQTTTKYSIATPQEAVTESSADSIIDTTSKAERILNKHTNYFVSDIADILSIPSRARRDFLKPTAQKLAAEYMKNGTISQKISNALFEEAYNQGVVADDQYFRQYKEVRDYLRTTRMTISEMDSSSIPDFTDFRKRYFGTLNLVNDGGTPVDVVYRDMSELYPALFPQDILNPVDQLLHIADTVRGIQKTELKLREAHGSEAKMFKSHARHEFERAVEKFSEDLGVVKRYNAYRATVSAKTNAAANADVKDVKYIEEQYKALKTARNNRDNVVKNTLLTGSSNPSTGDKAIVNSLLLGETTLEKLGGFKNYDGIKKVYEAEKRFKDIQSIIDEYNNANKARLHQEAARFLTHSETWKDKAAGFFYSRETMERNIRDISGNSQEGEALINHYFKPIHKNEAGRNKLKNTYRNRIRALNISSKVLRGNKVSESYAVQWLGEVNFIISKLESERKGATEHGATLDEWRFAKGVFLGENPLLDMAKINRSIGEFRNIYDELFEQMNDARVRNGYEPVDYRKGYFPHFSETEGDSRLKNFGEALGIDMNVTTLPTSINGLTHLFKPGIRWEGHTLQRTGNKTEYDALKGFDKYLEGVSDIIMHTDDIQALRALSREIRYKFSEDGIKKEIKKIQDDPNRQPIDKEKAIDEKLSPIDEKLSNSLSALSNFVVNLEEYTNLLANKRTSTDREVQKYVAPVWYRFVVGLQNRIAANMVAINPASWLTNLIPLTQGGSQLKTTSLLTGMYDTLKAYKTDDGFAERSTFLTNRRGSELLSLKWNERMSGKLSSPMTVIDSFIADSLVRARYAENIKKNMSEGAAMDEADAWAAGVMADRSKGSMPTLFESHNPVIKLFTQFQLEVNNQVSWLTKDLPREQGQMGAKAVVASLFKFAFASFLYNFAYEKLIGRKPALDPIGILLETSESFKEGGLGKAGVTLVDKALDNVPFIGGLREGGRFPVSAAVPDNVWENATGLVDGSIPFKKAGHELIRELAKPVAYIALPFGGGQAKKALEGIEAVTRDGSYSVDTEGRDILQYPINNKGFEGGMNTVRAIVFGKSSLNTGTNWINSEFNSASPRETAAYQSAIKSGANSKTAYAIADSAGSVKRETGEEQTLTQKRADIIRKGDLSDVQKSDIFRNIVLDSRDDEETGRISDQKFYDQLITSGADSVKLYKAFDGMKCAVKEADKRAAIKLSNLTSEQKAAIYERYFASDKEITLLRAMIDTDPGELYNVLNGMKGKSKDIEKRIVLLASSLDEYERERVYSEIVLNDSNRDSALEKVYDVESLGLNFNEYMRIHNKYSAIKDLTQGARAQADAFAHWLEKQDYTRQQSSGLFEIFAYYNMFPIKGEIGKDLLSGRQTFQKPVFEKRVFEKKSYFGG